MRWAGINVSVICELLQQSRSGKTVKEENYMRTWHKSIPMKKLHEELGLYKGVWSSQMDRYWESSDGYTVSSRQIRTPIGTVEHLAIERIGGGDIPWAVKQEIKDELFGSRSVAIEVFPAKKNLVDVADVYHLWVLPKDYQLPFGIHPTREPQGSPVQRGYDFNMDDVLSWNNSPDRQQVYK